jgi:DNA primase
MGKVSLDSAKYLIEAELKSSGIVEKSDVVGAIFGQTEGLLGDELDLRELRETGKVGRMDVEIETRDGKSRATIKIPTNMDATNAALLGASLETIDKVGPSSADIRVREIRDVRVNKRDYIVKRARQLLESMNDQSPDVEQITEDIKQEMREKEITEYRGFDAGPGAASSDEIILVEGKADVINLLKNGVRNALAIGGTSVPSGIEEIADDKQVTAFLDGDRGGELIMKELEESSSVDKVAWAPDGKEVEELDKKTIHEKLRDREPVKYAEEAEAEREISEEKMERFGEVLHDIKGTRAVNVLSSDGEILERKPASKISSLETGEADAVVIDGEAGEREVGAAEDLGAEYLVASRRSDTVSSSNTVILTGEDLER